MAKKKSKKKKDKKAKKAFKPQFWVLTVAYCEPGLVGPYDTSEERDDEARNIAKVGGFELVSWLDIREDGPHTGAFTTDDDEDEELPQLELEKKETDDATA